MVLKDHDGQNLYPFSDQNGSKTKPFRATHTYIAYIGDCTLPSPPPPPHSFIFIPICGEVDKKKNVLTNSCSGEWARSSLTNVMIAIQIFSC